MDFQTQFFQGESLSLRAPSPLMGKADRGQEPVPKKINFLLEKKNHIHLIEVMNNSPDENIKKKLDFFTI